MLLPLALGIFVCTPWPAHDDLALKLLNPTTHEESSLIRQPEDRLDPPKYCPKAIGIDQKRLRFDWITAVYGYLPPSPNGDRTAALKLRIYSQERNGDIDPAMKVARLLARLWEYNFHDLKLDQSSTFHEGTVDVYLCDSGRPGGEQLFDVDPDLHAATGDLEKVNTIYVYDLPSFTDPVEMAREVAHEYGHATLQPIGGYAEPEDWANGYLGEKLFLRHILQGFDAKTMNTADVMHIDPEKLRAWVRANVDPLVVAAAQRGPDVAALKDRSSAGMDAFIGLALYIDTILPEAEFSRSLTFIPSTKAVDYPDAIVLAAEEPVDPYKLKIPDYLKGKRIWVPLGPSKIAGADVLKRSGDWAQIMPGNSPIVVTPKRDIG